ncbi:MAG: zinc-binding dehydrogenase [Bacteroidota bacterium]
MQALGVLAADQGVQLHEAPEPQVGEGEVMVDIAAAALNHRDVWITKGQYPGIAFPTILGSDGAGRIGDREVIINPSFDWGDNPAVQGADYNILGLPRNGCFAERVAVPAEQVYDKPEHLTMAQAAALPLAGLTAYRALFTRAQVRAGERVLISGVGGGVALFACQFALAIGAEVFVTSSSEEKIARAVELGAQGGANYRTEDWAKAFGKQTGGFDVIIDSAGGEGFKNLVRLCRPGGRIAFYGGTRGKFPALSPQILFWKQISILGSTMGNATEFAAMVDLVRDKQIVPVVDREFALAEGPAAFDRMDQGLQFGKIVLTI